MSGDNKHSIYPAIVIGAGETGLDILELVSTRFAECGRFDGGIPEIVKFIHIETRDEGRNRKGDDEFGITAFRLKFDHGKISSLAKTDENIQKWFDVEALTGGSGSAFDPATVADTRILGRLALFSSFSDIKKQLESILESLAKYSEFNSDNIPLGIFVILPFNDTASTAIASDLAYIIRQAVFNKTVERTCENYGYFMLPDAFCGTPDSSLEQAKINTVAALKEIDFFMERTAPFNACYGDGFAISSGIGAQKPYDFAYLISAVNITSQKILEKILCEKIFHIAGSELTLC